MLTTPCPSKPHGVCAVVLGGASWPGSGPWIWMAPQCGQTGERWSQACPPEWAHVVVLTVGGRVQKGQPCGRAEGPELCSSHDTVWLSIIPAWVSVEFLFIIFSMIWAVYLLSTLTKSTHRVHNKWQAEVPVTHFLELLCKCKSSNTLMICFWI